MTDTSPHMAARFDLMFRQKSGEERLRMGCSMHEAAKRLVIASILEKDPQANSAALRRQLFLRFYGHEFEPAQRERVLNRL